MISIIHHITRTTYNEENPFGLREPFGVASTNINLVREQIAVQAAEYLKNGLGEGFKARDGEILQHDQEGSLKVTKTSTGIGCEFTGNEITFWLAEEDKSNFDQGVVFEISSQPYSEDGFVYPDIPTLEGDDDTVITELKYNIFSRRLRVTYHKKKDEETLKNSEHVFTHTNRYVESNGKTYSGHTDMNGSFNWDDEKDGSIEDRLWNGWEKDVLINVKEQFTSNGTGFIIKEFAIDFEYDGTSDYLAMGEDETRPLDEEESISVDLSIQEQRYMCELICNEIDSAKADQLEKARQMDSTGVAVLQTHIEFLESILKKLEI